jgi:hypothetical protein
MVRIFVISLFLVGLNCSTALAQKANGIDWYEEIDLLETELVKRHPNLFFETDSASFYGAMDRVVEASHDSSDFAISVMLQQVVAGLGDAHTQVNYHYKIDTRYILPLECYWFEDGLYVIKTRKNHSAILGKKIVGINHYSISEVTDSLATLIAAPTLVRAKSAIPRMITWSQLLQHFGFADTTRLSLVVEDEPGHSISHEIIFPARESEFISIEPDSIPLSWQEKNTFFREQYLPKEKLYYIQYNKCWSREAEVEFGSGASALFMPSFKEFEKKVLPDLRSESIEKLVFDFRFNDGGSSIQGTKLIRKIRKTRIGDRASIYLIIGRQTFSSAIVNAVDLMKTFNVVLVGEESGGSPNHFGEVERFVLPRSFLVVNCSTEYIEMLEDSPPSLIPAIGTPTTFSDYMMGVDPAMEAILDQIPE